MSKRLQLVFLLLILGFTKTWAGNPNSCSNPAVANLCGSGTFMVNTDTITNENTIWNVNGQPIYAYGANIYYQVNLPVSSYQPVSLQASLAGYVPNCTGCNSTIYFLWFENSPCSSNPVAVNSYSVSGTSTIQDSIFTSYTIGNVQSQYYLVIGFSQNYYNGYQYALQLGFTNNQPLPTPTCSPAPFPYKGQFAEDKSSCYTSVSPYKLPLRVMNDNHNDVNVLYPLILNQKDTLLPIDDNNGNGFMLTIKTEDDQVNQNERYESFNQFPYTYSSSYNVPYIYDVAITVFFKNNGGATGLKGFRMQIPGSYNNTNNYTYPKSGVYDVGGNWVVTYDANSQTYTWLFRGTGIRGDNVANNGYSCEAYTFDAEILYLGNSIKAWYLPDNYGNDSTQCVYGPSVPPRVDCGNLPGDFEQQNWIALSGSAAGGASSGITGSQCGSSQSIDNGPVFEQCGNYYNNYSTITYDSSGCAYETDYYNDYLSADFTFSDFNLATTSYAVDYGGFCNGTYYSLTLSGNGLYNVKVGTIPSVIAYFDSTTNQYYAVDSLGKILYNVNLTNGFLSQYDIPAYPVNSTSFTVPLSVKGRYTIFYFSNSSVYKDTTYYSASYFTSSCQAGSVIIAGDTTKLVFAYDSIQLCLGQATQVSIPNVVNYKWTPSYSANQTQLYPTVSTAYTVTVTDKYGCSNTTNLKVNVEYCRPYITGINGYSNDCSGLCTNLYAYVYNTPSNLQWTFYGGTPATYSGGETASNVCYPKAGIYPFKLLVSDTAGRDSTIGFVQIGSCIPQASFNVDSAICQSQGCVSFHTYYMVNAPAYQYIWSFPGGTPSYYATDSFNYNFPDLIQVCYTDTGTYIAQEIAYHSPYGGSTLNDTLTKTIHITNCGGKPVADFSIKTDTICRTGYVNIKNTSTGGTSFQWTFAGSTFSTSTYSGKDPFNIFYDTAGSYTIQLIAKNFDGADTITKTILVNNCNATADFSINTDTICRTGCVTLANASTGATSWQWNFAGGTPTTYSGQNPPNICYNTTGSYTVQLIAINASASDTLTKTVLVNACNPTAAFSINNDTICRTGCVTLANTSTGAKGWRWTFAGGSPSTYTGQNPPNVCYNTAGSYTVQLIVSNNYGADTVYHALVVDACKPMAVFSINTDTICRTGCVTLSNTSTGATSWQWNFAGGTPTTYSGQNPPNICYNATGSYTVQLIAINASASDTLTKTVLVNACNPTAAFSINNDTICRTGCITLNNTSTGATSWQWSFEGGNPSTYTGQNPPNVCYADTGTFSITLVAGNVSGNDTSVRLIVIENCDVPKAAFSPSDTEICATNCVSFTSFSTGNITSWKWIFDGGTPSTYIGTNPPLVCFNHAGVYIVNLIVTNSYGGDTIAEYVLVDNCKPKAGLNGPDSICAGSCVTFNNTSSANSTQWNWQFEGGSPANYIGQNPPIICYQGGGVYGIRLIASNSYGSDTAYDSITVFNPVAGNITALYNGFCKGTSPSLTLVNSLGAVQWQVSDTTFSFINIPGANDTSNRIQVLNHDVYIRVVSQIGNCADTSALFKVNVVTPITLNYTWKDSGLLVIFNAISDSLNNISYSWNFGDGDTSSISNPVHLFAKDSSYYVCLSAYEIGSENCSYTYCQTLNVGISGMPTVSAKGNIHVYPDPFSNYLLVKANGNSINSIELYDVLGRQIINHKAGVGQQIDNVIRLDVSTLIDGMYYIRIKTNNADYIQNVVKMGK